jgi:hypothetical protein
MQKLLSWISLRLELYLRRATYYACLDTDNETILVVHTSLYINTLFQEREKKQSGVLRVAIPRHLCERFTKETYDSGGPFTLWKKFCSIHDVEWLNFI